MTGRLRGGGGCAGRPANWCSRSRARAAGRVTNRLPPDRCRSATGLLGGSVGSYIPVAMMKGAIAIPDVDPKTWRSRGRKKRKQPAVATIVTPAPMKKRAGPITRQNEQINATGQQRRSAIVEPKKPRNTMLAHLVDDYDPEAHRRAGEKAQELFREIVRHAAKRD
jgi:hypothetical protein